MQTIDQRHAEGGVFNPWQNYGKLIHPPNYPPPTSLYPNGKSLKLPKI